MKGKTNFIKRGDIWYYRWTNKRKNSQWKSTGKTLIKEADIVVDEWKRLGIIRLPSDKLMIADIVDEVLYKVKLKLPRSYNIYKEVMNRFKLILGNRPVSGMGEDDLDEYIEERRKQNSKRIKGETITDLTIHKEIRTIKSGFNKIRKKYRHQSIYFNIMDIIEYVNIKVPKSNKVKKFLDHEEQKIFKHINKQISENAINENNPIFRYCYLAKNAGLRLDEATCLQRKDIRMETRIIAITNKPEIKFNIKDDDERTVPINDELFDKLCIWLNYSETAGNITELHDPNEFIIKKLNNTKFTKGRVSRNHAGFIQSFGITGKGAHSWRHYFADKLREKGVDIKTAMDLMGHSDVKTLLIYWQSDEKSKRKAVESINS